MHKAHTAQTCTEKTSKATGAALAPAPPCAYGLVDDVVRVLATRPPITACMQPVCQSGFPYSHQCIYFNTLPCSDMLRHGYTATLAFLYMGVHKTDLCDHLQQWLDSRDALCVQDMHYCTKAGSDISKTRESFKLYLKAKQCSPKAPQIQRVVSEQAS